MTLNELCSLSLNTICADLVGAIDANTAALAQVNSSLSMAPVAVKRLIDGAGVLQLVAGDDYPAADGRAIQFGLIDSAPDLGGATVHLLVRRSPVDSAEPGRRYRQVDPVYEPGVVPCPPAPSVLLDLVGFDFFFLLKKFTFMH